MKKRLSYSIIVIGLLLEVLIGQPYTLDQFLLLVDKNSKDLQLAEKELEIADATYKEAFSTALPKVFAEATYNRNLRKMFLYVDFPDFETGETTKQKFQMSYNNDFMATAMLQQTLFSLQVGDALRAAKQYDKLVNYTYEASYQAIITIAKKGFYRALLLKKIWEVMEAAEQNAMENYDNVKKRYENGLVSELDLLQAEVNWKNKIPETTQAKRNYEMGLILLKNFAGISVDINLELNGNLDGYPAMPDSMEMVSILHLRPDYNALLWEKDLRKTGLSAEKSGYFPTLSGHFVYNYSASSDKFNIQDRKNSYYFVGVNLQVPIFTGGYTSAQVQKARVNLDKSEITIKKTEDDIIQSIKNIRLRLKEAYSRIQSADKTRETAYRAFDIAQTSAENGLATQLELKDARMQVEQAVLNYYMATYDYLDAYYEWELATGRAARPVVSDQTGE
jgi:outer membrane protein TolC